MVRMLEIEGGISFVEAEEVLVAEEVFMGGSVEVLVVVLSIEVVPEHATHVAK